MADTGPQLKKKKKKKNFIPLRFLYEKLTIIWKARARASVAPVIINIIQWEKKSWRSSHIKGESINRIIVWQGPLKKSFQNSIILTVTRHFELSWCCVFSWITRAVCFCFIRHHPVSRAIHNNFWQLIRGVQSLNRPLSTLTPHCVKLFTSIAFFCKYYKQGPEGETCENKMAYPCRSWLS